MVDERNEVPEEEVEETQEQETSSEEERSYDDEFEALWGDGDSDDEPDLPESSEEEDDEEVAESAEDEDEDEEQEVPKEASSKPKPTKKDTEDDPYAWIESLPEEVRDKAVLLRNQANSHHGRATAFQRRVTELQEELRRYERDRDSEPADRKSASKPAAPEQLPEKVRKLKEDFPEFAEALEELHEYERTQFEQRLKERLSPLEEDRTRQMRDQFTQAVDRAAEDIFNTSETGVHWKDVVEGPDFRAWLELQPKSIQNAAREPDPNEAIYVLRRYEDDYQREVERLGLNKQESKDSESSSSSSSTRAEELKKKRKARKATSTAPGSKPVAKDRSNDGGLSYHDEFERQWG